MDLIVVIILMISISVLMYKKGDELNKFVIGILYYMVYSMGILLLAGIFEGSEINPTIIGIVTIIYIIPLLLLKKKVRKFIHEIFYKILDNKLK